jgi:hypothetical protein
MRAHLMRLTGRALFGYLFRLITLDKDYRFLRRQNEAAQTAQRLEQEQAAAIAELRLSSKRRWFTGAGRLFRVHDDGAVECFLQTGHLREITGWLAGAAEHSFWKRVLDREFLHAPNA